MSSTKDKSIPIKSGLTDDIVLDDIAEEASDIVEESNLESDQKQTAGQTLADDPAIDVAKLQTDLEGLQLKSEQMQQQLQRAVADYHNLEKRVAEGRAELASWVGSNLISKLLPTLDHLETALLGVSDEEQKSGWVKGVQMSVKQLKQVLKDEGLEEVKAEGEFDPSLHEAVDIHEGDNNKILSVSQKGYTLNGKILRPAKVVVGKKGI